MNDRALGIQARHYDGQRPIGTDVTLALEGQTAFVTGDRLQGTYYRWDLKVSPRIGEADRFVALPDGGQLQCADTPLLDELYHEVWSEGWVSALERRWSVAVAGVAALAVLLTVAYVYGIPWAAQKVAARIPVASELAFGRRVLDTLDGISWLIRPTTVKAERQERLRRRFTEIARGLPRSGNAQLEFRHSFNLGANAFALPGGIVVVTDDLVRLAVDDNEIVAILAHELGHVERIHVVRRLLQSSGVAAIAAAITGDAASLAAAVTAIPTTLVESSYSRELETEADTFAFDLLKRNSISPDAFANMLERLGRSESKQKSRFASTHPITSERVARARMAARE